VSAVSARRPRIEAPAATAAGVPDPPGDPTEAIVEAAARCFARFGIARTRVEDIAGEAGLLRPNVYRYFAGKDAIVHEVVVRQIRHHHARLTRRYPLKGAPADLIVKALVSGIEESARDLYATSLIRHEAAGLTATFLTSSPDVIGAIREYWVPVLTWARRQGVLRADVDIDAAIRWLTFLQYSYLSMPELSPRGQALEAELRQFVVPSLLRTRPKTR